MPDFTLALGYGFATGMVMVIMPRVLAYPFAFVRKFLDRA